MKRLILPGLIIFGLIINSNAQSQKTALELDGIDDFVEVYDTASLDLNGPMTISLWYYYS